MPADIETALPRQTALAWAMVVIAAVLALPTVNAFRSATAEPESPGNWVVATGMALVFVLGPLLLAWGLLRIRVHISGSTVSRTYGDRVVHELQFSQVTRIRVKREGSFMTITLWGDDPRGRPLQFPVSMAYVRDLEPLAQHLDTELQRRPDLFVDADERRSWTEFRSSGP